MSNYYHPVEQIKRIAVVDILRGWAILGVAIGNYSGLPHINGYSGNCNDLSETLIKLDQFFFAGKSWTLLTLLFGYGFGVVMNSVVAKGKNTIAFFTWRMLLLFLLAIFHSAFWYGDILKDYAFLGLILLLFHKSSAKTLGVMSAVVFLTIPFVMAHVNHISFEMKDIVSNPEYLKLYYSGNWLDFFKFNLLASFYQQIIIPGYAITAHLVMMGCMFFGFMLQKVDFFNRLDEMRKLLKYVFFGSFLFAVIIGIIFYFGIKSKAGFFAVFHPYFWLNLSTMIFIASGITLLYINGKLKKVFRYFSAGGKMTLTNYIAQNILGALIFSGIGFGVTLALPYWFYFFLAVFVFIIQLFISKWWLSKYHYGPIEWLWRCASYREWFPFGKTGS